MADLFQNGEYVMYGTYGVCQITGTTEQQIGANRLLYYVLKPVFQQSSTVFVPLSNRQLTAWLHRVLTRAELEQLVDSMPGQQPIWTDDETERRTLFQKILTEGNRIDIIRLVKTLYDRQQERLAKGKRLHQRDERFFREADRLLCNEFAFVLNRKPEEIPAILQRRLTSASG